MSAAEGLRAALYTRVSTEEQAREGVSLPAQEERLRAFVASQGWSVAEVYTDDGYSAKSLDRPAVQRLISHVIARRFDVVLVYKLDRLSRRQRDILHLIEDVFEPNGVGFRSVTESFDTTSPSGKAMVGMLGVFAQLERETTVQRVQMGKAQAAKLGRWRGGPRPFGLIYDPETKKAVAHPTEAPLARLIFEKYVIEGWGVTKIAEWLRTNGYTLAGGGVWSRGSVRQVLTSASLAGYARHKDDLYDAAWEAVVPRSLWEAAGTARTSRRIAARGVRSGKYLLTGVLRCGLCGSRMSGFPKKPWTNPKTGETKGEWRYYYTCRNRQDRDWTRKHGIAKCKLAYVRVDELEPQVIAALCDATQLTEDRVAAILADEMHERPDAEEPDPDDQLRDVERRMERLLMALEEGALDARAYRERMEALTARKADLQAQRRRARTADPAGVHGEDLLKVLTDLPRVWSSLDAMQRIDLIHALVDTVTVHPGGRFDLKIKF